MRDLKRDREIGEYWERQFCIMASGRGFLVTPNQIGRAKSAQAFTKSRGQWHRFTLPDIVVWTAPGQHHEIKHKNPTRWGAYGLETYRFDALVSFANESRQDVMYTIHNYDLNGGKGNRCNSEGHWFTANILDLAKHLPSRPDTRWGSYINSEYVDNVPMWFWQSELFIPLVSYWSANPNKSLTVGRAYGTHGPGVYQ